MTASQHPPSPPEKQWVFGENICAIHHDLKQCRTYKNWHNHFVNHHCHTLLVLHSSLSSFLCPLPLLLLQSPITPSISRTSILLTLTCVMGQYHYISLVYSNLHTMGHLYPTSLSSTFRLPLVLLCYYQNSPLASKTAVQFHPVAYKYCLNVTCSLSLCYPIYSLRALLRDTPSPFLPPATPCPPLQRQQATPLWTGGFE